MQKTFHALYLLALALFSVMQTANRQRHTDIVFIIADDLGYGNLSCYNPQGHICTPNIDQLTQQGARYA